MSVEQKRIQEITARAAKFKKHRGVPRPHTDMVYDTDVHYLLTQLTRLQATIDKLPKDAEGNPCLTSEIRYALGSDGEVHAGNVAMGVLILLNGAEKIPLRRAYGTRAAAQAATKAQEAQ